MTVDCPCAGVPRRLSVGYSTARLVLLGVALAYVVIAVALQVGYVAVDLGPLADSFTSGYAAGALACLATGMLPTSTVVRYVGMVLVVAAPGVHGIVLLDAVDPPAVTAAVRCFLIVGLELALWPAVLRSAADRRRGYRPPALPVR